jgi:hypothetical protein
MTEAEWMACTDPRELLQFLRGKAGPRKLRLFAAACAHRVLHLARDEWNAFAAEAAEHHADGRLDAEGLDSISREGEAGCMASPDQARAYLAAYPDPLLAAEAMCEDAAHLLADPSRSPDPDARGRAVATLAGLARDVFGNLVRDVPVDPAWLTWGGGTVARLAQATYDERSLPRGELDPARLAVLADALEEAGCTDTDILGHLRGPGPHVRGCWVLDLLLGKE